MGKVECSSRLAMCTFLDPRLKTIFSKNNDAMEKAKKRIIYAVADIINKKIEKHNISEVGTNENNKNDDNRATTTAPATKTFFLGFC